MLNNISYRYGAVRFQHDLNKFGVNGEYRQLCLIRTDVDPKFLSGLGKIRIMHIGIICIGKDWDLPICPVYTKIRITHVRIKQSCQYKTKCFQQNLGEVLGRFFPQNQCERELKKKK